MPTGSNTTGGSQGGVPTPQYAGNHCFHVLRPFDLVMKFLLASGARSDTAAAAEPLLGVEKDLCPELSFSRLFDLGCSIRLFNNMYSIRRSCSKDDFRCMQAWPARIGRPSRKSLLLKEAARVFVEKKHHSSMCLGGLLFCTESFARPAPQPPQA